MVEHAFAFTCVNMHIHYRYSDVLAAYMKTLAIGGSGPWELYFVGTRTWFPRKPALK